MISLSRALTDPQNQKGCYPYQYLQEPDLGLHILTYCSDLKHGSELVQETGEQILRYIQKQKKIILEHQDEQPLVDQFFLKKIIENAIFQIKNTLQVFYQKNEKNIEVSTEVLLITTDLVILGHIGETKTYLMRPQEFLLDRKTTFFPFEPILPFSISKKLKNQIIPVQQQAKQNIFALSSRLSIRDTLMLCTPEIAKVFKEKTSENILEKISAIDSQLTIDDFTQALKKVIPHKKAEEGTAIIIRPQMKQKKTLIQASKIAKQVAALKSCALLQNVIETDTDIDILYAVSDHPHLLAGQKILTKGSSVDRLSIIISGKLHVYFEDHHIQSLELESGNVIGELEFLEGTEALADVYTMEESDLITFDKQQFNALKESHPLLMLRFIEALLNQVKQKLYFVTSERNQLFYKKTKKRMHHFDSKKSFL